MAHAFGLYTFSDLMTFMAVGFAIGYVSHWLYALVMTAITKRE